MAEADPVPPKKTKGQQKIEVKAMDDAKKRSVTFTKRKAGLFRKADQLCNLTGAEVALMVISPGGKPYTFGNPDMDTVIARYKSHAPASMMLERQKAELREIIIQLAYEDRRAERLRNNRRYMMTETWMAAPIQTLSPPKQEKMMKRMVELKKVLSQPPRFNSFGFWWPPPDSSFEFPGCSFTALPGLHGSSGLPCGSFMSPVTKNQNFGGNMVFTPSGNLYTGESSSTVPARSQDLMFMDNMMMNAHGSFYTGESSLMMPASTQNQMYEGNMLLTPGNFCTGKPSSMLPVENQNHVFEDSMIVTPLGNPHTGEPSSMLPVENHNHVFENNMIATPPGNFCTGESSSSMVPAETLNDHIFQNNMMLDDNGSFFTCESSSMASEAPSIMYNDNMMLAANDNFFTNGLLSEEGTLNHIIDENIMIPPTDNFYTCGSSEVVPPPVGENQTFDENVMVPPNDNFYTCGSSMVVPPPPPAEVYQIFDENIMAPPKDNYNTFESSVVPATDDDDNLFSEENLRLFLDDDQFCGSSSSSMVTPPQPPPCDGYGAGPSGFN